jgi:hypothetical protein
MGEQPNLTVTNIKVGHQVEPDGKGGMATVKTLSYNVGQHGPFFHKYPPGAGDANQMKSDIAAQKAELADLHSSTS